MSTDLIITRHSDDGKYIADFDAWLWQAAPATPAPGYLRSAACPTCGQQPVAFQYPANLVACLACGLRLTLTAQEADDLDWALLGLSATDPTLLLAAIAARQTPPEPPPGPLYCRISKNGELKRVAPPQDTHESTWGRLMRLADQGEANGVQISRVGDSLVFHATSQRTRAGQPVRRYRIEQVAGAWACSCAATGPCAHLGVFYRRLDERMQQEQAARRAQRENNTTHAPIIAQNDANSVFLSRPNEVAA